MTRVLTALRGRVIHFSRTISHVGYTKGDMVSSAPTSGGTRSSSSWLKVAAAFVSALAFNWLSNLFAPAAPIVLFLAMIALVLLLLVDSPGNRFSPAFLAHFGHKDLAKFSLASLLIGAVIAGMWLLPLGQSRAVRADLVYQLVSTVMQRPYSGVYFNYEIGAAATLIILGIIALLRRTKISDVLIFGIAGFGGVSLTLVTLRPQNNFLGTFAGWTALYCLLIIVLSVFPDIVRLMRSFWRV